MSRDVYVVGYSRFPATAGYHSECQEGTTMRCPICAGQELLPVIDKYGYSHVRCTVCRVVFVHPMPTADVLVAHYQEPGYFAGDVEQGYLDYTAMHKALEPHFRRRLRGLSAQLGQPGRLLDYGCADGYFLQLAGEEGWQIAGVELASEMRERASQMLGIPIAPSLEEISVQDLDAITLWEVIEHLPEPIAELGRLCEHLRPGGILMLSTPNAGHWQAVHEPQCWESYRPPSHLVLFSAGGLIRALQQAGFVQIALRKTAPLPWLPAWLRLATEPLRQALSTGQACSWRMSLYTWRLIRAFGWAWQRAFDPGGDVWTTLEAVGFREP